MVQGGAHEGGRQRGKETEYGEADERPGRGHDAGGPVPLHEGEVLGPVAGTNRRGVDGLRDEGQPQYGQHEQDGKDGVGNDQWGTHELGQGSCDQRAYPQAAEIGRRGDHLEAPVAGTRAAQGVQVAQVGGGRGRDHPDPQPADKAGHDQAGKRGPDQEQHRGHHLEGQSRPQDTTPTHPVRDVARPTLDLTALADQSLVGYPAGFGVRALADQALLWRRVQPHYAFEVNDTTTLLDLVEAGLGVSLVPEAIARLRPGLHRATTKGRTWTWTIAAETPRARTSQPGRPRPVVPPARDPADRSLCGFVKGQGPADRAAASAAV